MDEKIEIKVFITDKSQCNILFVDKTFKYVFNAIIETPTGASQITKLGATSGAGKG
jgi:hypothetical protein